MARRRRQPTRAVAHHPPARQGVGDEQRYYPHLAPEPKTPSTPAVPSRPDLHHLGYCLEGASSILLSALNTESNAVWTDASVDRILLVIDSRDGIAAKLHEYDENWSSSFLAARDVVRETAKALGLTIPPSVLARAEPAPTRRPGPAPGG